MLLNLVEMAVGVSSVPAVDNVDEDDVCTPLTKVVANISIDNAIDVAYFLRELFTFCFEFVHDNLHVCCCG